jgi:Mn-dependent DtxR family transcriptional regulator
VIVLGWSHRTPTIVQELLRTRERVERFLARHGARKLRIVILAERVDAALTAQLRERLGALWNDRQVLLRSGSPLRLEHLERVALQEAAVLILPGADHATPRP